MKEQKILGMLFHELLFFILLSYNCKTKNSFQEFIFIFFLYDLYRILSNQTCCCSFKTSKFLLFIVTLDSKQILRLEPWILI